MQTALPDDLHTHVLSDIIREAKDYCLVNGIIFRLKNTDSNDVVELAPVTVFPSPFPRKCFELALSIQTNVNLLMHRVAHDHQFLFESLERVLQVDQFTRNLHEVHEKVLKAGTAQNLQFGQIRADYMQDIGPDGSQQNLKQVEVNVIAAGFAIMGPKLTNFHRHIVSKYRSPRDADQYLPLNLCDQNFAQAFIDAWSAYGNEKAIILIVVEDRTINLSDQRSMDFCIGRMRPDIKIIRRSLTELVSCAQTRDNNRLFIDNNYEVALIYFRYGYDPAHYISEDYWRLRFDMERSMAIKCPSIGYQLAGVKKIQQILCRPNTLERFLDQKSAQEMYKIFAGIYSLELSDEGDRNIEMVLKSPGHFVLKPQREGGGNNVYGSDIPSFLGPIKSSEQRSAYIAMDRIRPPALTNLLISPRLASDPIQQIDSELGIFGSILGTASDIQFNRTAGHVLRSKMIRFNEGGVSSGQGVIDSPFLY